MAKFIRSSTCAVASLTAVLMLSGCYTQMGSVREDRDRDYVYQERDNAYQDQDSSAVTDSTNQGSGEYAETYYDSDHSRCYYDYYYPSFTFGLGYYSSWWHPWWAWGSWYYDPYYYGTYYGPWGWGSYPGYTPGWWYPYYHGGYAYSWRNSGRTRTFGNSRMVGATRGAHGNTGGAVIPGGVRSSTGGGARSGVVTGRSQTRNSPARPSSRVSSGRRSPSSGRYISPGTGGTVNRGERNQGRREEARSRAVPTQRSQGWSGGARSSGGGRSYSSPPSSAPSRGSSAPSGGGGGSRGGGGGGGDRHSGGRR